MGESLKPFYTSWDLVIAKYTFIAISLRLAQQAGALEYTDCISAEG